MRCVFLRGNIHGDNTYNPENIEYQETWPNSRVTTNVKSVSWYKARAVLDLSSVSRDRYFKFPEVLWLVP